MKARIEQLEEELEGALQRSHNMNNSLLKSNSKSKQLSSNSLMITFSFLNTLYNFILFRN